MSLNLSTSLQFLLPNGPKDFLMLIMISLMLGLCVEGTAQPDPFENPDLDTISTVVMTPPPFDPILDTLVDVIDSPPPFDPITDIVENIIIPPPIPTDPITEEIIDEPGPDSGTNHGDARDVDKIIIPNLFTPNGDGYNETWMISGLRSRGKYDIQIYSRQGSLLYESHDYANDWDGTFKGTPLPSGTYYYIFRIEKAGFLQRGMLNILRP